MNNNCLHRGWNITAAKSGLQFKILAKKLIIGVPFSCAKREVAKSFARANLAHFSHNSVSCEISYVISCFAQERGTPGASFLDLTYISTVYASSELVLEVEVSSKISS